MPPERSALTPERWERVSELFASALDLAPSERALCLAEATRDDPSLAAEVEALLAADGQAASFLSTPAWPALPLEGTDEAGSTLIGRRIGPYRVLGEIGRGGMGAVYRAERDDDQYHKQVAIKIVRGDREAAFFLRRFRTERQILAGLEHPNIARLLDGGRTEEGWPYFSMEFVEGQTIDLHCASLPVRETIELFRTVCAAVQHAHQRLVVHRDLKPSNILVSSEGVPKLLDFGIAKLVEADQEPSSLPATVGPLMTPAYASPEQIRGETVTTASDTYSLGVVLYELLAGRRPYQLKSTAPEELLRVVCSEDPPAPSQVAGKARAQHLSGDLDTIVLKAMHKEPSRRYATPLDLAEDLRRYLVGLPVTARRDTLAYRVAKFVGRHRVAVAAATLLALSLVAGIVGTTWQARIAAQNRARAEQRLVEVRALAHALLFDVHDAVADLPGATRARRILIEQALQYLDRLASESADDPSLQRDLARAYDRLGDLQGKLNSPNLGDAAGARDSYGKALALREALAAAAPDDLAIQLDLAQSYSTQAEARWIAADPAGAAALHRRARDIGLRLQAKAPDDADVKRRIAYSRIQLGHMLAATGAFSVGLEEMRQGVSALEGLAAAAPEDAEALRNVSVAYSMIADIQGELHPDLSVARASQEKALEISRRLVARDPENGLFRHGLAVDHCSLGDLLARQGDLPGALELYRTAAGLLAPLADADADDMTYAGHLAVIRSRIGTALARLAQPAAALEHLRAARAVLEPLAAADASNQLNRVAIADLDTGFGQAEAARGRWREAREHFERSRQVWLDLRARGSTTGSQAARPEDLDREIARCDEALGAAR